jgi:peptidase M15-like protein
VGTGVTEEQPQPRARRRRAPRFVSQLASLGVFGSAAVGVIQFYHPPRQFVVSRGDVALDDSTGPLALASPNAFGKSGQVRVLFALPGNAVVYPMELRGDPSDVAYAWIPFADTGLVAALPRESTRPLETRFQAPEKPGFYRLALVKGTEHVLVDGPALSVMVPFSAKLGSTLNGYRIGTYVAERLGARARGGVDEAPPGFVEIDENNLDLPLTKHLRLSDFVTHDNQESWPRYAALDARLLDKIELVVSEIGRLSGKGDDASFELDVHSGFRTPLHNRRVRRAARDSRHQYGDAADIAIDSNGDGRISFADTRLVARAVEVVEQEHPDLVGGMGLYNRGDASYVHIDARGKRARWRG